MKRCVFVSVLLLVILQFSTYDAVAQIESGDSLIQEKASIAKSPAPKQKLTDGLVDHNAKDFVGAAGPNFQFDFYADSSHSTWRGVKKSDQS